MNDIDTARQYVSWLLSGGTNGACLVCSFDTEQFYELLVETMAKATPENLDRLAAAFPEYAQAVREYQAGLLREM